MNIYAANLSGIIGNGGLLRPDAAKMEERRVKAKMEKNPYQQAVFENNAERDGRTERIMAKFYGGKKLSSDDLSYLAKHAPDCYKKISEIMQQREELERQMEQAESTLDVAMVYANTLASAQKLTEGEQARENPWTIMGMVGQFNNAYGEFTSSPEYREKETEETKAEEIRASAEEYGEQLEEAADQIREAEISPEQIPAETEIITPNQEVSGSAEQNPDAAETLKEQQREEKERSRERRRRMGGSTAGTFSDGPEQLAAAVERQMQFRRKVNALYKTGSKRTETYPSGSVRESIRTGDAAVKGAGTIDVEL